MTIRLLTKHHLGFSKLKIRLHILILVYPCQNVTLLKITFLSSFYFKVIFNDSGSTCRYDYVLLDFSLTVKAATLIFISGRCSAISSAKEGKSGYIYNLVKT